MHPLETYLREIRSTGSAVAETSFYPALSTLLNELGQTLKPRVRCVMPLANTGAGLPDGGLFTADQFSRRAAAEPIADQPPSRGAIEAKGTREEVVDIADTEQVGGYQVMKKWLSYREQKLLGRGLTQDEARYVTEMARRIAALLLLGPALDANYAAVKADTYAWPQ